MKLAAACLFITILTFPRSARADLIAVGVVSFDVLIGGTDGVNAFHIGNFTGTSGLPPDFPVATDLTFRDATLTLEGSSTQTFSLGDIGPGSFSSPLLEFPSTTNFTKATFTATLSQVTFILVDGTTFVAASAAVSLTILPSSGSTLVAGTDFGLITLEAAVPEPGTWIFVMSGLAAAFGLKLRRRNNDSSVQSWAKKDSS